MDTACQVGPEKPDYTKDLHSIAATLEHHHVVHVALCALGSRWGIVLTPKTALHSYGQEPRGIEPYDHAPGYTPDDGPWRKLLANNYTLVSVIEGHRTGVYMFAVGSWHEPGYVASKLFGLDKPAPIDGLVLSAFLNRIERVRMRLRGDEQAMANLEVWEWTHYETLCRGEGVSALGDRFVEATGCDPGTAMDLAAGRVKIR